MTTNTIRPNEEDEIHYLYYELACHTRDAIARALDIGELLTQRKKQLPPDDWLPWLVNVVKFDEKTAANYIAASKHVLPFNLVALADVTVDVSLRKRLFPDDVSLRRRLFPDDSRRDHV
jgi:hypothetical protein